MYPARAKTAYRKCIHFWPDSARDARIMADMAACVGRVWLGRTSDSDEPSPASEAAWPCSPPWTFQGPSAIRTKAIAAWTHKRPAKRPLTAFHGRCGKPAMFDMKGGPRAVYGPYGGGFAHARGVTLTQACPKRPANAPQTVFRGNMGTWPYPPSRTFQGPFTGPAADMVA